tara:strand:+ start:13098 stop:14684 length:1587 start_codon:yes stop_codon:yes gene_type:complete
MAAASYTTDLQTYDLAITVTNWGELTGMVGTDGNGNADPDLAIHGATCISESQRKSGIGSIAYDGTAPTWTSGWSYFIWNKFFAPNSLGTLAQGGLRVAVGDTVANYYGWYVDGSDTYQYGGWKNYAVNPEENASAVQTQGTPNGTWNTVGMGYNLPINGISKGNSATVDIIRYGRGEAIITGGGPSPTFSYATFDGLALVNDNATTGRWGLFQDVGGSYLQKGLMSFGTASTAVDFRDSNVVINIDDTSIGVTSSFNRIEIVNAGSRVDWDTVLITKLGILSLGEFEVIDNADVNFDDCSFTGMSTFKFLSNSTINTTAWNICDQITQGGAVFSECDFTNSATSSAVIADNIANISNCHFTSDGTGHGIEIPTGATGTYIFTGNLFDGYATASGSTGNEMIYNNSGGLVTINVGSPGDTPTYRNGTAATTVVNNNITVTLTGIKDGTEVRVYDTGTQSELAGIESATGGGGIDDREFAFSLGAALVVDIVVHNIDYEYLRLDAFTIPGSNSSVPIQQRFDRNYSNPI